MLIEHRANPTVGLGPATMGVADLERSALDEHRRHRTTTAVEVGFDDERPEHPGGGLALGSSDASAVSTMASSSLSRLSSDLAETSTNMGVAAVLPGNQAVLRELAANLGRIGVRLVDLIQGHHDRHVGGLGMADGFFRLRHHTVVGGDHEHGNIGDVGTASTHVGEGLVTGRIDEGDATIVAVDLGVDLVRTDVLRDPAGSRLSDDVGVPDVCRATRSCRGRRDPGP